jgi:hypothetical protein
LVLLFNFEVPLKKLPKKATTKKGLHVCFPIFYAVVLCDYLCVQARVSSIV